MPQTPSTWFRAAAFLLATVFIVLGPAYQQVFGGHSPALRAWTMYQSYGINLCELTFQVVQPDGKKEIVNWRKILQTNPSGRSAFNRFRIENMGRAWEVAQEVRRQFPSDVDLRLSVRISSQTGWVPVFSDLAIPSETSPVP